MWRFLHGDWACGPGSFLGGPWGWFVNVLFWLVMILLAAALVRSMFHHRGRSPDKTPIEVLKHRYACGEIDREDFERMRREVSS